MAAHLEDLPQGGEDGVVRRGFLAGYSEAVLGLEGGQLPAPPRGARIRRHLLQLCLKLLHHRHPSATSARQAKWPLHWAPQLPAVLTRPW